ncbi:MAG: hypothetical protein ABSF83_15875 [Nitrososphaerales archaeon]|jgi:hypothetical protein
MEEEVSLPKRKTENRSFRIDSGVLSGLEEEAQRKKVSVNTLVNQLLADYIEVERHRKRLGTVEISASAFQLLLATASEEDIARAGGSSGPSVLKAYMLSKWGHQSVPNIFRFIRENASVTGLYDYSETASAPKTITLTHSMGKRWSIYMASFFSAAFEDAGQKIQVEVAEQAIWIKLL